MSEATSQISPVRAVVSKLASKQNTSDKKITNIVHVKTCGLLIPIIVN
jgi:hypothetical protein